jgi:hypothetical protein
MSYSSVQPRLEPSVNFANLLITDMRTAPSPVRRLIVLVPDHDLDESALARRVWSMAVPQRLGVLFLSIARDADHEWQLRRTLTMLAALTRDDRLVVESRMVAERDWLSVLQTEWQKGDLIVCHAGQSIRRLGRPSQRLAEVLVSRLRAPVCELTDFYAGKSRRASPLRTILKAVPLGIIGGFFEVQVLIAQSVRGGLATALMCATVVAEIGLIWAWESYNA